jgi:pimeloyl-ACP methyl ester carboxylesterase
MSDNHHGNQLNYITEGAGPPAILVHGLAASLYDWEVLVPELVSYGYRSFAVDLFGHGDSPKPDQPELYTASTLYQTLEDWIESLEASPPYLLVGHSLGGYLVLKYGLSHPGKVGAMVLIDPLFCPRQLSPVLRLFNRRPTIGMKALQAVPLKILDTVLGWDPINLAQFSPHARRQIALDYKRASPYIMNIPHTVPDLSPRLNEVKPATLVIWGDRDLTLNPASFPDLVEGLPNAAGHPIQACGHQPHIGKPVLVNRLIVDFLNAWRPQLVPLPHPSVDAPSTLR